MGRRGAILLMTLAVMVVVLALATSFLFVTSTFVRQSAWEEIDAKLIWLAEAGLAKGVWYLRVNNATWPPNPQNPFNETVNIGPGEYQVTVTRLAGQLRTVQSSGRITVNGQLYTRTVRRQYNKIGAVTVSPIADSWTELAPTP